MRAIGLVALAVWVGLIAAAHLYYARVDARAAAESRASVCLSHDGAPACTYSGNTALLSFRMLVTPADPCTFVKGAILAASHLQAQSQTLAPHTHTIVLLYQEDECAHQVTFDAYGESDTVTLTVADATLGRAKLTGPVRLFDRMSGDPFDMTVDLTWSATGATVQTSAVAGGESPGYRLSWRQGGAYTASSVSGTVAEDSNAFLEASELHGSFGETDAGAVTVVAT